MGFYFVVVMALAAFTGSGTSMQDREVTRPPQPLHKQTCGLPPTLQGVTGHVLFQYTVNEAGKVGFAKPVYSFAEPAARETEFVEAMQTCLGAWEYRPALFVGKPYAMELLMAFHFFRPPSFGDPMIEHRGEGQSPRSQLEDMSRHKAKLSMQLLAGPKYTELEGDAWVLRTDVGVAVREKAVGAIQFAQNVYGTLFPESPCTAGAQKVTLFLFGDQEEFNRISAFDNIQQQRWAAPGQYQPVEAIGYTVAGKRPMRLTAEALTEVVTHHLVQHCLIGREAERPFWVTQGIASFTARLRPPRKGEIDLSRFQYGNQVEGGYRWISPSTRLLETLEDRDRAGKMPDLADFLSDRWKEMDAELAEGLSWVMVHYLVNAEGGRHLPVFRTWLKVSASASDPGVPITQALGKTAAQLQVELRSYRDHLRSAR